MKFREKAGRATHVEEGCNHCEALAALDVLVSELEAAQKERDEACSRRIEMKAALRRRAEAAEERMREADAFLADPSGNPTDAINFARRALAAVSATPTPTKADADCCGAYAALDPNLICDDCPKFGPPTPTKENNG
jgi:hypothetical protein